MKTGARQFPFVAFCNFQMNEPGKKKQEGIEKFGGLRQTIISLPPLFRDLLIPRSSPSPSFECADFHRRLFSGKVSPKEKMFELGHAPASPRSNVYETQF